MRIADVDYPPWRHRGKTVVCIDVLRAVDPDWGCIDKATNSLDQIIDIGEVAHHLAIIVDVDRLTIQHCLGEFEQGHVGPAPRTINREKAKHRHRQAVEMRIAVRHRLGRFLGRGVEGHLMVRLHPFAIRHFRIGAIGRRR